MPKKQTLFPLEYDEISLVDSGAAGDADVLIFKRDTSKILKLNSPGQNSSSRKRGKRKRGRIRALPQATITSGTATTASSGSVSAGRKKKRKQSSDPCDPHSSTGKKTGKSSQRAKNWAEGKHPRQQGGKFGQTSSASKEKYGKGGTTKAKQVAECKRRHGGKAKSIIRYIPQNARAANARGRKKAARAGSAGVGASVTKNWKTDAQLRALVERKAAR